MRRSLFFASVLLVPLQAQASIVREFYRGAEPQAMGNAYVAIADDENAIFYNPAGVAGYEDFYLHFPKIDLTVSKDAIDLKDTVESFDSPSSTSLNPLMGKNIYLQGTGTAALLLPNLGLATFFDGQGSLSASNQAFPKVEFGYQKTTGFQVALGFSSTGKRKKVGRGKKNPRSQNEWRAGFAAKFVQRQGGYRVIPVADFIQYDTTEELMSIMGDSGTGYGADFGLQRIQKIGDRTTLHWGLAYTNIGDVAVGGGSDAVKSILASGIAAQFDAFLGKFTVAYDVRHLTREDDWRKKQHLGARFEFPFLLTLYGGLNQTYLTYGAGVDLLILKVNALSYAEESGSFVKQDPERRYQVTLEFKLPL